MQDFKMCGPSWYLSKIRTHKHWLTLDPFRMCLGPHKAKTLPACEPAVQPTTTFSFQLEWDLLAKVKPPSYLLWWTLQKEEIKPSLKCFGDKCWLSASPGLMALQLAFPELLVQRQRWRQACPLDADFMALTLDREQCKVSVMTNSTFRSLSSFVQHPLLSWESNLRVINGPGSWCVSISYLHSC